MPGGNDTFQQMLAMQQAQNQAMGGGWASSKINRGAQAFTAEGKGLISPNPPQTPTAALFNGGAWANKGGKPGFVKALFDNILEGAGRAKQAADQELALNMNSSLQAARELSTAGVQHAPIDGSSSGGSSFVSRISGGSRGAAMDV